MAKIWLVARHHFLQEASRRSFLLILFSMPLFVSFMVGFGYLMAQIEGGEKVVGYIDQAGILARGLELPEEEDVRLQAFSDRESAQSALEEERIDAFFVIDPNYSQNRQAEFVYVEHPGGQAVRTFFDTVRYNLLAGESQALVERSLAGPSVTVRAVDANREFPEGGPNAGQFLPLIAAVFFAFLVMTTSGYMTHVLVQEKENRTMEIVATSISPGRLMVGKVLGAIAIAALQLAVWLAFLAAAILIGRGPLEIEWLQNIQPIWRDLWVTLLVAIPAYLFIAGLMTLLGAVLTDTQEAQQVGGLSFLFVFLPIYVLVPISTSPNGALALAFSFFPATSVTTIAMRSLFMEVPFWQIALASLIGAVSAALAIVLAGKAFRLTMLRYGKRLRLRELLPGQRPAAGAKAVA